MNFLLKFFEKMAKKNKKTLHLNPQKMCIKKNDKGDYSILANANGITVEVGRYKDDDDDYIVNRIHEILEYIQD